MPGWEVGGALETSGRPVSEVLCAPGQQYEVKNLLLYTSGTGRFTHCFLCTQLSVLFSVRNLKDPKEG